MRPKNRKVNSTVAMEYTTCLMRKDGHFGTKVCTNVPPKKPNKHKEPTVLRLNLKPSHKDVRIFSIVTDASCDWNTARNTILNAVNKAEKKINTLISVFMPSNNRCHRFIINP